MSKKDSPEAGINTNQGETELLTIEEHARKRELSAPIFAAVKQVRGWAAGKAVSEDEFKRAVEAFLGAPISGVKTPIGRT